MLQTRISHHVIAVLLACLALAGCGADNGSDDGDGDGQDVTDGGGQDATDGGGQDTTTDGVPDASTDGAPDATDGGLDAIDPPDVGPRPQDLDADTLTNEQEGASADIDTDSDGVPDHMDDDSDGDGVPDLFEAGDFDFTTPPVDSDNDGTPDFRDLDADDNGIPDAVEGSGDTDGDGTRDFADLDNDGDGQEDASEFAGAGADCDGDGAADPLGTVDAPFDCNGDGVPDFMTPDADNDNISDRWEGQADTDDDGWLDRYDLDSDNDTIPDAVENEGVALNNAPRDTDGDGAADFRDPDSDDDGLSDADEYASGTNPYSDDSDDDGVSDLVEVAAGTDPNYAGDSPLINGDFVFVLPYEGTPDPEIDTLNFRTNFQQADVYFLFDRTGSMLSEVNAMRNAIGRIISNLTCARSIATCDSDDDCAPSEVCGLDGFCIANPADTGCIPSFYTGSGVYGGDPSDPAAPIANLQSINPNGEATASALPTEVGNYGTNEALFAAVECLVDPSACPDSWTTGCTASGLGCVGYRQDAVRIMMLITDEANGLPDPTYSAASAGATLAGQGVAFVGIDAANGVGVNGQADMEQLALAASSLDSTGQPFVRSGDGPTVVNLATEAIRELVNDVPTDVTIEAVEVEGDAGDARRFLDHLEVNLSGGPCTASDERGPLQTADTDADSFDDAFPSLLPGTSVCWDVTPVVNTFEQQGDGIKLYELRLIVRGNGATLDERSVFFLVPPAPIVIL